MSYLLNKTVDKLTGNAMDKVASSAADTIAKKLKNNDSTSIDAMTSKNTTSTTNSTATNFKLVLILFLIFIFIVSDIFTNTILSCFGQRVVKGRHPTAFGVIIQGIFLIIFYILFATLIKKGVI